ncbi:MAG: DnaJ domain-containing protein [Myxococcaceae bacterium]
MADPKDTSGEGKAPGPAVPAIPRLTPAVPEPVDTAPSPPRPPLAGAGTRAPGAALPATPSVPKVAPLVPPLPKMAPAARPPSRTPLPAPPSVPAVPKVPPVLATPAGRPAGKGPPPVPAPDAGAELERLFGVLDTLDYFEVMGLSPAAAPADIKRAFHQLSRTYHPDRFFQSQDAELRGRVHAIYKRVTEAYFVLRDDARRKKYFQDVTGPERLHKLRFDELAEAETKAAVKKEVAEQIGTHPKGRQFFQVGLADLEAGRLSSAERNIKLALTYEPTNPLYLQKLEEARAKSYEEFKRSGKGFRIE